MDDPRSSSAGHEQGGGAGAQGLAGKLDDSTLVFRHAALEAASLRAAVSQDSASALEDLEPRTQCLNRAE